MRRSLANVWFLAIFGLALVAVLSLVSEDWLSAGLALAGLIPAILSQTWWVPAIAALVSGALRVWVVAALLAVVAATKGLWFLALIRAAERPDHRLLADAVDRMDIGRGGLHREAPWTTADLLRVAAETGSRRRQWLTMSANVDRFDGPLLEPAPSCGPATLYAGEACKLAELVATTFDVPLDVDLYAAAATLVFDSAAQGAARGFAIFEEITGAHPAQISEVLQTFVSSHGGGDLTRRISRAHRRRWLGPSG